MTSQQMVSGGGRFASRNTRADTRDDAPAESSLLEHQRQLFDKLHKHGLKRFAAGGRVEGRQSNYRMKKYESYKKETQLPRQARDLHISVDVKNETLLLPIYGLAVPFHVSTLKNVHKGDEGDATVLRFNFVTPGQSGGRREAALLPSYDEADASFVRSMTFKSGDTYRFGQIYQAVNELKRAFQKREDQRREMADLVEQGGLVEVRGRRPARLAEVHVRPALEGKRVPGTVEVHQNGLRYQSQLRAEQRIDVLFSNVKHLFMQPCQGENLVLVHLHLKHDIIVGQRRTQHVQFYREVTSVAFDETGNRRRRVNYGDEDELLAEQEERRHRAQLDREFKQFADQIAEASSGLLKVDVPFRELAFEGVPFRQRVVLAPTVDCLVHLSEPPFLVVTLDEIEIVNLERVAHGLKEFDMVIVFTDFSRAPVHINTIPHQALAGIKEWLDGMDKVYFENPVNLNWREIMKTINDDPLGFFDDGGWAFLRTDASDGDASESASEFEVDEDEFEASSSAASESDYSSEASASSASASSGSEDGASSADDWDELERKAIAEEGRKRKSDAAASGTKKARR